MTRRSAIASWSGNLESGGGTVQLGPGEIEATYSFGSRFHEGEPGVNPEELIAGAHAGCYSMALVSELRDVGREPLEVETRADVHLTKTDDGLRIPRIDLTTEATVPELSPDEFRQIAEHASEVCPVSQLMASAEIRLDAKLRAGRER